ncbi:MAG: FHA domain-containing protein [Myxococcota bacterium]
MPRVDADQGAPPAPWDVVASAPPPVASPPPPLARVFARGESGADGASWPIESETCDIGRSEGAIVFANDVHLAPRHCRLERRDGLWSVIDLSAPNGVFVAVRQPVEIIDGDVLIIGRQLLRFERVTGEPPQPASEQGVRLIGSPIAPAWGRLRQLTIAGTAHDVVHLSRPEVTIGREEGDVRLPDDDRVARRHAVLRRTSAGATVADAGGGGGTFVRIRGRRVLASGDVLRVGAQTLRIEL